MHTSANISPHRLRRADFDGEAAPAAGREPVSISEVEIPRRLPPPLHLASAAHSVSVGWCADAAALASSALASSGWSLSSGVAASAAERLPALLSSGDICGARMKSPACISSPYVRA